MNTEILLVKLNKILELLQNKTVSKEAKVVLASSAPKEPADWFEPKVEAYGNWMYQFPQRGEQEVVRQRWYREYREKEKLLQWPNAYAEEVLKRID
jgi:hypothetical protein